jgi:hypothetical protein
MTVFITPMHIAVELFNTSDLYPEVSAFNFLFGAWLPLLIVQIFFPNVCGRIISHNNHIYITQTTIYQKNQGDATWQYVY